MADVPALSGECDAAILSGGLPFSFPSLHQTQELSKAFGSLSRQRSRESPSQPHRPLVWPVLAIALCPQCLAGTVVNNKFETDDRRGSSSPNKPPVTLESHRAPLPFCEASDSTPAWRITAMKKIESTLPCCPESALDQPVSLCHPKCLFYPAEPSRLYFDFLDPWTFRFGP
jgi:hypothetical protein